MTPRLVILSDLDDTLFQTERKLLARDRDEAVQVTRAMNGAHGFMTLPQAALAEWFAPGRTIPVTARGTEAFGRVDMAFGGAAIVANGAVLLDGAGTPDPEWQARILATLAPHRTELADLPDRAMREAAARGGAVRSWVVDEPGCGGVYAVVKVEPGTREALLAEIAPVLRAPLTGAWRVHLNGNNLALIPPEISKAAAVAFLLGRLRETGPVLAIGVGDSHSDLDFMRLCDFWMTPTASQLDRALGQTP